jgi:alpha-glucosidase (family GH31 glycosyl hydrolase)
MARTSALAAALTALAAAAHATPASVPPSAAPARGAQAVVAPVVTPFAANSFRIQWAPPGYPVADSPYTPFLPAPLSRSDASTAARTPGGGATYTHGNLAVAVDAGTGFVTATRVSDGAVVFEQTALAFAPAVAPGLPPSAQLEWAGPASPAEAFVGMGEQGLTGRATLQLPFFRDFQETEFYPNNTGRQAFMPLFFSTAGYGAMLSAPSYGWLRLAAAGGAGGSAYNSSCLRTLELWLTVTPGDPVLAPGAPHPLLALLAQHADAVGYGTPQPGFAAGFIVSKDRYRNQSQVMDVARGYVARGIPVSVMTIDWFHWARA